VKPRLRQRKTEGNQPRRPERAVLAPVLHTVDSGRIAEEETRRGALLYSRLVNSLDCIVWEADARTFQFSFVSPQVKRMLGYAPEEWLAPGFWAQHVHPEDVEWCTKFCMQATEEGRDHEFEYRMIAADGRTVWLHDVVSVQVGPEGPRHLTGVMIDITRRKVAEAARKESEEEFRLVFEKSAAGIVIGDTSGRIVRANPHFCEFVGFSQDELEGCTAMEITHPADRRATQAFLEEAKSGRTGLCGLEKRFVRPDGQVVWGRLSAVFVFPDTLAPYSICIVQDITDRKRAESLVALQKDTLEMVARGMPLKESLTTLVRQIELHSGMLGSIVLLDRDGVHVRHGAAPSLPEAYIKAIDGVPIGPRAGSCGTAMYRKEPVIVIDVMQDPLWEDYRDLAVAHGVRACWSTPILSTDRRVLGSFAMYYPETRGPSPVEMGLVDAATQLASIAIERQRTEELGSESEERFQRIFENAGLGTSLVDGHGHPIKCNPAIQKMLGYTESELRNMAFTEFTYPDDINLDWKLYSEVVAGKRDKYEIEKRYIRKNGEMMWGHLTVSLIRNRDGTPAEYTVGMVEDITERKQSEELLRESEERFRTMFENSGIGMALVSLQAYPVKCNPAIQKLLGYTDEELRGMAVSEFTHPDDVRLDMQLYSDLIAGKFEKYDLEKRYITKDGRTIWGHLTVSLIKDAEGVPKYAVGMIQDITERKRAELELRVAHDRSTKELAERTRAEAEIVRLSEKLINAQEEERTRIARELHDDLSQQIAGLGITLSNIKRQIPVDNREGREQAERAYDKLLTIGQGIRHLSHELHPAIIEHAGLVAALESYCIEFESLTKVSATVQAEGRFGDLPANAQLGIYRIAQEALQNIWKHAGVREAGMCLARAGERVQLQISDRGVGFDLAQLSKEAGLGLISMRERARLLGGSFSVESSPGKGTTIIAGIPVNPKPLRSPFTTSQNT
jgi:PAS domain S-box-containing protein